MNSRKPKKAYVAVLRHHSRNLEFQLEFTRTREDGLLHTDSAI
jgi:hypothetical protein